MTAKDVGHEFAVVSVWLTEPVDGVREVFRVSGLVQKLRGRRERYDSYVRTEAPVSVRERILRADQSASDPVYREPREVVAELRRMGAGRPLVVCGGGSAVAAIAQLLGQSAAPLYDLAELFDLLHPGAGSSDPRLLARRLGLVAEDDKGGGSADDVWAAIYVHLLREAEELDQALLYEIARRTATSNWPLGAFFAAVAESIDRGAADEMEAVESTTRAPTARIRQTPAPGNRKRNIPKDGVSEALAAAIAESGGGYESRPEQLQMAAAVDEALNEPHHLLVEAGTGTGKSLAYLFPAACYALRNDARVLVSTNTINLQEQLLDKDIPGVQRLLKGFGPEDVREQASGLRCAVLKGRRNYICLQRLALLRRAPALEDVEVRFLTRVLLWLARGGGDRAGLSLPPDEEPLWNRTCAEGTSCFVTGSPFVRDGSCQLAQARRRAEAAHLVVVNHALLLSDVAAERHVLPGYDRLIVDEAHNLEDEATDRFGFHATQAEIGNQLDAVHAHGRDHESGLVVDVRAAVAGGRGATDLEFLFSLLQQLSADVARARERLPEAFAVIRSFVEQHAASEGGYDKRLLLTSATRAQPDWSLLEIAWDNLDLCLSQVESGLERLAIAIGERDEATMLDKETLLGAIIAGELAVRATRDGVSTILGRHDETQIAWLTLSQGGIAGVSSAPLNVGEVLDASLFSAKGSVVLTSATLTAGGSFDYVRGRLGVTEAEELALGSPFDYQQAALVLLPSDMPEPAQPHYQAAVEESLVRICTASAGRALVLFTSHGALRATYRAVRGRLGEAGVRALAQGIDGTPQELLDALRADTATTVFGTSSFWEGVDVVGEALSVLVIAKLPFSVPSDPVFAARAELFDDPFRGYSLPQAILRFKQGFERLIRQRGDRGVAVVLDRRLRSKSYGRSFLQSLPACSMREAPIARLGDEVASWLAAPGTDTFADEASTHRIRRR